VIHGAGDVSEIERRLRKLLLIQWALIVSVLILAGVPEIASVPVGGHWGMPHWFVTGLALWGALGGSRLRQRLLRRSREGLARDGSDPKGLKQWEVGNVIGLAMAEGVAFWGLAMRFVLNGALWQASLFYAASLVLLLYWTPRMPVATAVR